MSSFSGRTRGLHHDCVHVPAVASESRQVLRGLNAGVIFFSVNLSLYVFISKVEDFPVKVYG